MSQRPLERSDAGISGVPAGLVENTKLVSPLQPTNAPFFVEIHNADGDSAASEKMEVDLI